MEYTCPLAEEIENPGRNIPLGIFLGLTLVSVPVVLFGLAAVRYVPSDQLGAFSPVAHMEAAIAILGDGGKWWMAFISIAATLSTLNALIAGVPRILYGMALTRQLPAFFAYLLPATRAPVVGIVAVALMPILMNVFIDLEHEHELHRADPRRRPRLGDRLHHHPRDGGRSCASASRTRPARSARRSCRCRR